MKGELKNPAHDYFQIECEKDHYMISILNLNGQILKSYNNISKSQKVDLSIFSSGTYLVQLRSSENGNAEMKKIVEK